MIYPMALMVLLTVGVGLKLITGRVAAVREKAVSIKYFQSYQGEDKEPDKLLRTSRSFSNMFEVPLLFYIACTLNIVIGNESQLALAFAWAFVASRFVHAYIHVTYNNVLHRMCAFFVGVFCMAVLWGNLVFIELSQ